MSIVNNYAFKNLRLKLTNVNYWDLVLSSDMRGYDNTTLYCDNIISGDTLLVSFDFNSDNCVSGRTIHSLSTWKDSILPKSGLTLCDIGLTGVDNGFVPNLTGETLFISSGDSRFYMTQVSGNTYEYPIILTGDSYVDYAQFNGGFYQGFYKLENYPIKKISDNKFLDCIPHNNDCLDNVCESGCNCPPPEVPNPVIDYQVLPNRFSVGWTSEFWLKKDSNPIIPTNTLNTTYPNNNGFFYTMGLRTENKFWDFFSGETGHTTCLDSGHTLNPPILYTDAMSGMNPFLYYTLKGCDDQTCDTCQCSVCECTDTGSYPYYGEKDYVADIVDNIIGFRVRDDGSIGYRKLSFTGQCSGSTIECCRTSGGTYVTGYTVEESYSMSGIVPSDRWVHVVIRYDADYMIPEDELDCPCSPLNPQYCPRPGQLSFYINGYLKYRVRVIKEMIPRGVNDWPEKQLGVPYTMSLGGGTQGLIETKTFGGPDNKDFELPIQENFAGSFIGGISKFRFYSEPLDITQLRCNFYYDSNRHGVTTDLPTQNHTPYDEININVQIIAEYHEGSIIGSYSAITDTLLTNDLDISFVNKLHLKTGGRIQLSPKITIKSGETVGLTTLAINDNFSKLSGEFEINSVIYDGVNIDKIKTSTNVMIKPIIVTPPPIPIVDSIYYGKLTTPNFVSSDITSFTRIDVNEGINLYVTLPLGMGYGYILISNNLEQPMLFRNSNEGCAGFIIPMTNLGTTIINDINNNSIIYSVYRTFVSTRADVDVWLCD